MPEITEHRGVLQTRVFQCRAEVRDEEPMEGNLQPIEMTPIVFNEESDPLWNWTERIEPTALDEALKNPDTRATVNHNPDLLMGRTTSFDLPNGEKTLQLWKESDGIKSKNYPPDVEYARALVASVKRGDMREASFQFYIKESRWEGDVENPVNVLEVIDPLIDVSYVTYPQYPQTSIDMRTVMELVGVDFEAVRNIAAKSRLKQKLTDGEKRFIQSGMKIFESLLSGASGDKLRGMAGDLGAVGSHCSETLRWLVKDMLIEIKEAKNE